MSIKTDVVIIGTGPCGLFQIFELGLLGIHAHVVDALPEIGGQCVALYPEKPIYDIPALPVVGARELVDRLAEQIRPFKPDFHLGEMVVKLECEPDGAFSLETSSGTRFRTRTVVVAGGLGSFQPRPLRLPGVKGYEGVNVEYKVLDKSRYRARRSRFSAAATRLSTGRWSWRRWRRASPWCIGARAFAPSPSRSSVCGRWPRRSPNASTSSSAGSAAWWRKAAP